MSKIKNFTDLEIYRQANEISFELHKKTQTFPLQEKYRIIDQLLRASYSVGANITEGFGRYHTKDFIKFLYIARGSLMEVKHFLILANNFSYIRKQELNEFNTKIDILGIKINNLIGAISKRLNKTTEPQNHKTTTL